MLVKLTQVKIITITIRQDQTKIYIRDKLLIEVLCKMMFKMKKLLENINLLKEIQNNFS